MATSPQEGAVEEGMLLGLGNPLLDISIHGDMALLSHYSLLPNNAILADNRHQDLFSRMIKEYDPSYLPGGATQNSIRVAQWMLRKPKATSFIGSIGDDDLSGVLRQKAEEVGVNVCFQVQKGAKTGRCGAIITGENRSLVTDAGAAQLLTADYLDQPETWKLIQKAKCFYIGGFVIPYYPNVVLKIAKHAADTDKILAMNLHATFICKYFTDPELQMMKYIDVLFGNNDEAEEFARLQGIKSTNLKDIALATAALPKQNPQRERIVLITRGKDPTIVAHKGEVKEYAILPIDPNLIQDTNGCGDAFVGGFLSQLVQKCPLKACMQCGFYCARVVIQHFGCNYPPEPDYHPE